MEKLARYKGIRKGKSNVGAVAGGTDTAPGRRAKGSPHGSNARRWIDGHGAMQDSWLTVEPTHPEDALDHLWSVVRVDVSGALRLETRTVLVVCRDLCDATEELANWSHALDLPYRDHDLAFTFPPATFDPAAGYPHD